jgi:pantoate--beta-alanine ligase
VRSVQSIADLRTQIANWRRAGLRIGLVPTMGNLHAGHIALAERARELADRVVATIFVNPTQFVAGEDYAQYPRTLDKDSRWFEQAGVDLLFAPPAEAIYPEGPAMQTKVDVAALDGRLCGAFRPGHFPGVATVITKLFNLVQPDLAVFGEKDYQQLLVIKRLVRDLFIPVEVIGHPTVREADGLAMSSRNAYLSADEREIAPQLYASLQRAAQALAAGDVDLAAIGAAGREYLTRLGFKPDYFSVCSADSLEPPRADETDLIVLAAAWLGRARLIDNVRAERPSRPGASR